MIGGAGEIPRLFSSGAWQRLGPVAVQRFRAVWLVPYSIKVFAKQHAILLRWMRFKLVVFFGNFESSPPVVKVSKLVNKSLFGSEPTARPDEFAKEKESLTQDLSAHDRVPVACPGNDFAAFNRAICGANNNWFVHLKK